jgi:3-methyl-2-oxobutanoate hydroxymethyltransferase
VLVLQDMLGITQGKLPRFVRNFMADESSEGKRGNGSIAAALQRYVAAVRDGSFPVESTHTY